MSFTQVRAAIKTRLLTIDGITTVISGMPNTIQGIPPLFITEFQSGIRAGQSPAFYWRFMIHAVISNQANTVAEDEIDDLVDATMRAFSSKLNDVNGRPLAMLGGVANMCEFEDVRSGETDGYISFGNPPVLFRRIGFLLKVKTLEDY